MPTYDYQCRNGHRFEVFQKMSDEPVSKCPECAAVAERQISGGAGFLFKGDGFYITDYRSDEYKKKASADSGDAKKSGGDTKPEKKAKGESKTSSDSSASKSASDS